MRIAIALATFCVAASAAAPAAAALPPKYQRLAEFRAVLNHPGVARALDEVPIERIEYVRADLYRVSAGRCQVDVRIVDLPSPRHVVGGRRFEARPGQRVCRR